MGLGTRFVANMLAASKGRGADFPNLHGMLEGRSMNCLVAAHRGSSRSLKETIEHVIAQLEAVTKLNLQFENGAE